MGIGASRIQYMNNETDQPIDPDKPSNSTLLIYLLSTFVAVTVIALTTMIMAIGAGAALGFETENAAPQAAMAMWGISGLSFLPCMVLVIVVAGTHKRSVAVALGLTVIVAGILTAAGWFTKSGGAMPGTTAGDAIVISGVLVPLVAGAIMIWRSSTLKA